MTGDTSQAPSADRQYYQATRPEVAALLPEHYGNVLEIGCGEGGFAMQLRPDGEVWGVEPFNPAAIVAGQRLSRVLVGTYDQVRDALPDRFFDIVVCNDVIEHMVDHDAFFVSIQQKMTPGGWLIGSVPNVRNFWNLYNLLVKRDWAYTDTGILDRTHLRWFTEKSLRRSLLSNGFEIEAFGGINSLFRPGVTFSSFSERAKSLAVRAMVAASFGFNSDMQYVQYVFRARRAP